MRPIPRELVQDFPSASASGLLEAHAQRLVELESRDRTRMIEVDEWSAFALADAIDDAWARRIESFGWTPMAYRMLVADYRWFRDLPLLAQAAAAVAIVAFGPGLFYFGRSALMNRYPQTYQVQFRPTAMGARFDVLRPPVYPGSIVRPGDPVIYRGAVVGKSTKYVAAAAIGKVRRWYEDRMPADGEETMLQAGGREYYSFRVQRPDADTTLNISQESEDVTDIYVIVRHP